MLSISELALLAIGVLHLCTCPYSKVEESFGLQGVYDLVYTTGGITTHIEQYDHVSFPGVVPRSFVPLVAVAAIIKPLVLIFSGGRFLVRLVPLLFVWTGHCRVARRRNNPYYLWVTASQFHLNFYASRFLPNTWALGVCLYAYAAWLEGRVERAARLLVFCVAVLRCDCLILLFTVGLSWLLTRQLTVWRALRIGMEAGLLSLLVSVPVDSWLWQRFVWPEGEVLYYNTVLNKSSDWGVSAWHWYWTSALPKSLLGAVVLIPLAVWKLPEQLVGMEMRLRRKIKTRQQSDSIDTAILPYLLPALGFVSLYSNLGHKEVRFLFPALPLFNMAAAHGMMRLHQLAFRRYDKKEDDEPRTTSWIARIGYLAGILCLLSSLFASVVFLAVSHLNYPGGNGMNALLDHLTQHPPLGPVHVHIDVASAMSGVSLWEQRMVEESLPAVSDWKWSKDGYEETNQSSNDTSVTHRLSEKEWSGYAVVATLPGNPILKWSERRIETTPAIYLLEKLN